MTDEPKSAYIGYPATVGGITGYAEKQAIAREDLMEALSRFEKRLAMRRAELDQALMQSRFLEREVSTLQEACEAVGSVIRRSEETDPVAEPKRNW